MRRAATLASCMMVLLVGTACSASTTEQAPSTPLARTHLVSTEEYLPSVEADVYLPEQAESTPVVVLAPGGGWQSADRAGLGQLAEALAAAGMAVVNASYRAADVGETFPVPVQDLLCAASFAVDRVGSAGHRAGPLLLVGHSAGAHLAALAVLAGDELRGDCPYAPVPAEGLIGLAGPYDVSDVPGLAEPLFGVLPEEAPGLWRNGNPRTWADRDPSSSALLIHGGADPIVPVSFTQEFGETLRAAGHGVSIELLPDADHDDVYQAHVIAPIVIGWIKETFS
jgi:acetyl esterase/lipase